MSAETGRDGHVGAGAVRPPLFQSLARHRASIAGPGLLFVGNAAGAALGFAVLLLLTRTLSPERFGLLAPALTVLDVAQVLIDSLVFAGVVQVAARHLTNDPARARMAMKIGLVLRLGVAGVLLIGLWSLAPWLAGMIWGGPDLAWLLRVAALGTVGIAVHTHATSIALTRQDYGPAAALSGLKNLTRLAFLAAVAGVAGMSLGGAIWAVTAAALVSAAASLLFARFDFLREPGIDRSVLREILAINGWAAIATLGMLAGRVDVFMLSALSDAEQTAFYAVSLQLCVMVTLFSQALANFVFPRLAGYASRARMRRHFRKGARLMPLVLVPFAIVAVLADWLVPLVLGAAYAEASTTFILLVGSAFLTLAFNPVGLLLFPLGRVRVLAYAAVAQLVARVVINVAVIPAYGAVGAATVDLVTKIAISVAVLWLLRAWLWSRPDRARAQAAVEA